VAGCVTSIITIAVLGATLRLSRARRAGDGQRRGIDPGAAFAGALAGLALLCYLLATRTALITVAVVPSLLYPVRPRTARHHRARERLTSRQACGLAAALAAPVLIATAGAAARGTSSVRDAGRRVRLPARDKCSEAETQEDPLTGWVFDPCHTRLVLVDLGSRELNTAPADDTTMRSHV
jgi:hypothetical protein